jgi:hypothetical protein
MGDVKRVYFAGKVKKGGGYREKLLGNGRVMSNGYREYSLHGGRVLYGGPFALGCDHGCCHGDGTHGLMKPGCFGGYAEDLPELVELGSHNTYLDSGKIIGRCLKQISSSDAVHCYIETISCYGTLFELGFATAKSLPIYIYYAESQHNWDKHLWFTMKSPHVKHCGPGIETSIHPDLLTPAETYKERYHAYLLSPEWAERRALKMGEANGRCQLCNGSDRLQCHHRTYDRVFEESQSDLIVLCDKCHTLFHEARDATT